MKVKINKAVSIRYIIKNGRGEVLENRLDGPPVTYLHGSGTILPALEAALHGLEAGVVKTIFISPAQGYAGTDDDFVVEVAIDAVRPATAEEIKQGQINCGPDCIC